MYQFSLQKFFVVVIKNILGAINLNNVSFFYLIFESIDIFTSIFEPSKPLYSKMNHKTEDPSIKMFHVINNSLVTSDGFTYYSISFGIKHANKANKVVTSVPNPKHV